MNNSREFYTTGQVAAFCSVTPDTVLKWVKAGKIPSTRTAGGHYRIPSHAVQDLLNGRGVSNLPVKRAPAEVQHRSFQYCWEFNAVAGEVNKDCLGCLVYQAKAGRCYEVNRIAKELGDQQLACRGICEECDYYSVVKGQRLNVLMVTDQPKLRAVIQASEVERKFNLAFAVCEYDCSMLVEKFRPDFAIVDCSLGTERAKEFARHLADDPRIPFVRIILAGHRNQFPEECDREVFAFIEHPFDARDLSTLIEETQVDREYVFAG